MTLPEEIEGLPVEVWAIEQVLSGAPFVKTMADVNPDSLTPSVMADAIGIGGHGTPGYPCLWWDSSGIAVQTNWMADPGLIIPYSRVVEYVRGEYVEQTALF